MVVVEVAMRRHSLWRYLAVASLMAAAVAFVVAVVMAVVRVRAVASTMMRFVVVAVVVAGAVAVVAVAVVGVSGKVGGVIDGSSSCWNKGADIVQIIVARSLVNTPSS